VHRGEPDKALALCSEAEHALREAQTALQDHPAIKHAGFLHDAEKEYAEARLTAALIAGTPLPGFEELRVGVPAWVNGLAEAASELRRNTLDRLRAGEHERAETLLAAMDDVYGVLVTFDYPDAITGGLRRTVDALRAVLERTRSDLTLTSVQQRLADLIERQLGDPS
jgi:translin